MEKSATTPVRPRSPFPVSAQRPHRRRNRVTSETTHSDHQGRPIQPSSYSSSKPYCNDRAANWIKSDREWVFGDCAGESAQRASSHVEQSQVFQAVPPSGVKRHWNPRVKPLNTLFKTENKSSHAQDPFEVELERGERKTGKRMDTQRRSQAPVRLVPHPRRRDQDHLPLRLDGEYADEKQKGFTEDGAQNRQSGQLLHG